MNKNKALELFEKCKDITSPDFEHAKALVLTRCTAAIEHPLEDLRDKISEHIDSTRSLSSRIFWLNVVLAIATGLGAIFGGITLLCKLCGKF